MSGGRPRGTESQESRHGFRRGLVAFFVPLTGPLDDRADMFILSAHMFPYLTLTLVVPPLGTPSWGGS